MVLRTLAVLVLCAASAGLAPAQEKGAPRRETFEELLARARAQRDALQDRLGTDVKDRVARLEANERTTKPADLERAIADVVGLGSEATPLLVPYLDPGSQPPARDSLRAKRVAEALTRMDTASVTDALLAALDRFSDEGRKNVLVVLETAKEPERVRPKVAVLFKDAQGQVKGAALRALFALGAAHDPIFVKEVLLGPDADLTRLALRAMADGRQPAMLDAVATLEGDAKRAGPLLTELVAYLRAVKEHLRDEDLIAFAKLANAQELEVEKRTAVLDVLPTLADKLAPDLRKILERASESRDRKARESAFVARVCLGDKGARRDLMLEYDERVKKNERWAPAFGERAEVLYRIRDFDAAVKDFNTAITVGKNDPTPRPEYYVGLARSYAMLGRMKEASEWLERAPITFDELKSLAEDPAFAKLREHTKYGAVFGAK
jgi:tetratricopeptide (TPR) repeat protein